MRRGWDVADSPKRTRTRWDVLFILDCRAGTIDVHGHVPLPLLPRKSSTLAFAFLAKDSLDVFGGGGVFHCAVEPEWSRVGVRVT